MVPDLGDSAKDTGSDCSGGNATAAASSCMLPKTRSCFETNEKSSALDQSEPAFRLKS